jgi:hypothetical protein
MTSLVTTTVTAVMTAANQTPALGDKLGLIAVLAFIVLIIQQDIASGTGTNRAQKLAQGFAIALVPLGAVTAVLWLLRIVRLVPPG